MFVVCIPVTSWPDYRAFALPGVARLRRAAPDTVIVARESHSSYQETVNGILDEITGMSDLEGAVIIHQDVELLDDALTMVLRKAFHDERVAVVGAVGSRDRSGLQWWAGEGRGGRIELPDGHEPVVINSGLSIVTAVDGMLLALSPWATGALRFDPLFQADFHGYDIDICMQARAHGRLVGADNIAIRHHQLDGLRDGRARTWVNADVAIRRKWDLAASSPGLNWARGPMPQITGPSTGDGLAKRRISAPRPQSDLRRMASRMWRATGPRGDLQLPAGQRHRRD